MPEVVHLYIHLSFAFWKQMLHGANTDLFIPLVPKAHKIECQNLLFALQIKPVS